VVILEFVSPSAPSCPTRAEKNGAQLEPTGAPLFAPPHFCRPGLCDRPFLRSSTLHLPRHSHVDEPVLSARSVPFLIKRLVSS
jgi:hypothetical protein